MVFYAQLGWLPPGRLSDWANRIVDGPDFHHYTALVTVDALFNGRVDLFLDALRHLLLPVATLVYASLALYLRITRAAMVEVLHQEYVLAARARGLSGRSVVYRHALRNALLPIVTISGLTVAGLLGGVVLVETIFVYPGIGAAAVQAAAQLDIVTTLALTLLGSLIIVLVNLVVDLLHALFDPRLRLGA
jgi:peptide/nickel transport system permease protein